MKKVFYLSLAILVLFASISCASTKNSLPTVSVTANAELKVEPDVAFFSVTAESVENTTDQARAKTSQMVNQAIDILASGFGISKDDIKTDYINVGPSYIWKDNERVLEGQRAVQSVEVTLRNIDIYGNVFESLSKIDGISVSNATLDKATAYAEASGMNISGVLSISDGSNVSYSYPNLMMAKASSYDGVESSTAYYAGDISISDSVSVVYQMTK